MSWKRTLFLLHRWAGIVLCLFFALWFISGLFMMYVEFPQLTRPERLAGSPPLNFSGASLSPADALAKLQPADFVRRATPSGFEPVAPSETVTPRSIRLAMIAERPAYVIHSDTRAQPRVVFADNGEVLRDVTTAMGHAAAAAFQRRSDGSEPPSITLEDIVHTDQWSVSSGLNDHRPLLKYSMNDARGTVLHVSSTTGEVVRDSHRMERALNYFGAVTHWIYPTFIRKYPLLWEWIVDIVSGVGVILAISGLWIGVLRWKRRADPGKPQVPYKGLMRWHYFTGITFGIVTVTWVFSGLLSMNPLNLNPPQSAERDQQLIYSGKQLAAADFVLPARGFGPAAADADLVHYASQAFYRVTDLDGSVHLLAGNDESGLLPDAATMIALAPRLIPGASIVAATPLTAYDNYYYSRRPDRGDSPLPAIRVRFADPQHTWFHLDPITGQILERSTRTNRVYRWLYNGLHSFDIWWLWQRRPLWDICVIAFSLGGLLLPGIGVVIGWRRLRFKSRRRSARTAASTSEPEAIEALRSQ